MKKTSLLFVALVGFIAMNLFSGCVSTKEMTSLSSRVNYLEGKVAGHGERLDLLAEGLKKHGTAINEDRARLSKLGADLEGLAQANNEGLAFIRAEVATQKVAVDAEIKAALAKIPRGPSKRDFAELKLRLEGSLEPEPSWITFGEGEWSSDEAEKKLAEIACKAKGKDVVLKGYANTRRGKGGKAANEELTEKRVEWSKKILVKNGVDPAKITIEACGENADFGRAVAIFVK